MEKGQQETLKQVLFFRVSISLGLEEDQFLIIYHFLERCMVNTGVGARKFIGQG